MGNCSDTTETSQPNQNPPANTNAQKTITSNP